MEQSPSAARLVSSPMVMTLLSNCLNDDLPLSLRVQQIRLVDSGMNVMRT